jgi:hypothetical protein
MKMQELKPAKLGGVVAKKATHYIQPDIQPYQAMAVDKATGKAPMITSRREHNEFLKRNDFVCVGNDAPTKAKPKEINVTSRQELSNAIDRVAEKHGIRIQA